MCHDPIVIDPPDFDLAAAWESCREAQENVIDEDGEVNWGNAFGADPGCVSCPACREMHWAWGQRQRCTQCGFVFPTGWWSRAAEGVQDRGTLPLSTVAPKRPDDPYYMHGWRNPGLTSRNRDAVDWPGVVASFTPWTPTPEERDAIERAVHGDCKHYRGIAHNPTCEAGVHLRQLVGGDDYGWASRLPCLESFRNRPNGPTAYCEHFAAPTPEEIAAEEAEHAEVMARFEKVGLLFGEIKRENRGKSASGVRPCPACGGNLHWTHARYNGHVSLFCETDHCVNVIE